MSLNERKEKILELLEEKGSVYVSDLSVLFGVSEVTIRNDLSDLESKGLLSRVHGGAVSSYKPYYNMNLSQRMKANQSKKTEIAGKVSALICDNDTIMINSGTTSLLAFRALPTEYHLTIVTNSIAIALEAATIPNFNIILLGGSVNTTYQFTYGDDAVALLKNYHADKVILSVDGIDLENGFTTYYDKEVSIARTMMEQSTTRIAVADTSKFERTAFTKIADLSVAHYIVTNASLGDDLYGELTHRGITVLR